MENCKRGSVRRVGIVADVRNKCLQTAKQDYQLSTATFGFIHNNPYVESYNNYSLKSVINRPKPFFNP
jgi:hypothetical protein